MVFCWWEGYQQTVLCTLFCPPCTSVEIYCSLFIVDVGLLSSILQASCHCMMLPLALPVPTVHVELKLTWIP